MRRHCMLHAAAGIEVQVRAYSRRRRQFFVVACCRPCIVWQRASVPGLCSVKTGHHTHAPLPLRLIIGRCVVLCSLPRPLHSS